MTEYHIGEETDAGYSPLLRPDGTELAFLGEVEDREWYRDLNRLLALVTASAIEGRGTMTLPIVTRGVDYSWARPGGAAIRQAGFTFAVRYVPYPGDGGKRLTADELADLRANGLAVVLVYESTADRAGEGFDAGRSDAITAAARVADLGFPRDQPIYFAVDYDADPSDVVAYFQGVGSWLALARIGVYGSHRVVTYLHQGLLAAYAWQALAWSGGQHYQGRHLYQVLNGQTLNGGAVDYNEANQADFGQWPAAEETDMADPRVDEILRFLAGVTDPLARLAEYRAQFGGNVLARLVVLESGPNEYTTAAEVREIMADAVPEHTHSQPDTGGVV